MIFSGKPAGEDRYGEQRGLVGPFLSKRLGHRGDRGGIDAPAEQHPDRKAAAKTTSDSLTKQLAKTLNIVLVARVAGHDRWIHLPVSLQAEAIAVHQESMRGTELLDALKERGIWITKI